MLRVTDFADERASNTTVKVMMIRKSTVEVIGSMRDATPTEGVWQHN